MLNRQNEGLLLRVYQLPQNYENDFCEIFEQLVESDSVLNNFKAAPVTFVCCDPNHSLVPDSFFDNNELESFYMKDQLDLENNKLLSDRIDAIQHYTVFGINKNIWKSIKEFYPQLSIKCNSSVMLDQILDSNIDTGRKIVINIGQKLMEVSVIENKQLKFHNSYSFNTPEDCLYYIVNTCNQQKLNYQEEHFVLNGNLYESGGLYQMLRIYLPNIQFGKRTKRYNLEKILGDSPEHLHFDLLAI